MHKTTNGLLINQCALLHIFIKNLYLQHYNGGHEVLWEFRESIQMENHMFRSLNAHFVIDPGTITI